MTHWQVVKKLILQVLIISFALAFSAEAQISIYKQKTSKRAVIFLHGFWGDPQETFSAGEPHPSWPELIAADTDKEKNGLPLSDYSIITIKYEADRGDALAVEEISSNLLMRLEQHQALRDNEELFFITHSLGGLVLKQMLLTSSQGRGLLLAKTKSVFLIGSPAAGSWIADLGSLVHRLAGRPILDLRTTDNSWLKDLDRKWSRFRQEHKDGKRIQSFCAYETKKLRNVALIVPREYADRYYCIGEPFALNEDHMSMVKPTSREHTVYRWVRDNIVANDIDLPGLSANEGVATQKLGLSTKVSKSDLQDKQQINQNVSENPDSNAECASIRALINDEQAQAQHELIARTAFAKCFSLSSVARPSASTRGKTQSKSAQEELRALNAKQTTSRGDFGKGVTVKGSLKHSDQRSGVSAERRAALDANARGLAEFTTEEALVYFKKATKADPTFATGWYNVGFSLAQLNREKEALVALDSAVRHDPSGAVMSRLLRAHINMSNGQTDQAVSDFDFLSKNKDYLKYAAVGLCRAYVRKGDREKSKVNCDWALAKTEGDLVLNAAALGDRASGAIAVGAFSDALADLRKVDWNAAANAAQKTWLANKFYYSGISGGLFERGVANFKIGQRKEAKSDFVAFLNSGHVSDHDRYFDSIMYLGQITLELNELEESLSWWQKAPSGEAEAQYKKGRVLAKLGRENDAKIAYEAAVKIDPNHGGARRALNNINNACFRGGQC